MSKIRIEDILEKYVIVVSGEEKRVVYDVDDSRVFSVHITGCGRGARNAVLSKSTFKTLEQAQKGITYLEDCFVYKYRALTVRELQKVSKEGYDYLMEDIEDYNSGIDWDKKRLKEERVEAQKEYQILAEKAQSIIMGGIIERIDEVEEGVYNIIIYNRDAK